MIQKNILHNNIVNIFKKYDIPSDVAETITDVLIHANLRGIDSHGVLRVSHYIKRIKEGGINKKPQYKTHKKTETTYLFDGDNGFGHHISKKAMDLAIQTSKKEGISAVGVKNSSHCGALSYYAQQAAEENMIGIVMTHTDKVVAPFGSSEQFFGTNPVAFGFPTKNEPPFILDFATSNVAFGKILDAREKNTSIPIHWGIDKLGNPTSNPHEIVSLTHFGGPKGYGLAFVIEVFSALLTGSAFGPHITEMYGDYNKNRELGHFFLVLDPSKFLAIETFTSRLDQMITELHSTTPMPGFEQVYVPGEQEMITASEREKEGIPLPQSVLEFIRQELNE